ncbi:MAG: hypothetical protein KGJ13_10085 [Patescibacteria group bacterium]|nr:hypothetical protein [Patescibacteria group bacterium]
MLVTDIPVVRVALRILSERVLTILALLMTFILSAWAMYQPALEREGMAAFFAVAVFLPCVVQDRRRSIDVTQAKDEKDAQG